MNLTDRVNRRKLLGLAASGLASPLAAAGAEMKDPKLAAKKPAEDFKGLKVGLASYSTRTLSVEDTIACCKRVGIKYIALKDVHLKLTASKEERAAVRAHWTEFEPAEAMARINRTVCQNVTEGKYVTFFMARLDPGTGQLTYVNAGQDPPLLVRATEEVRELDEGGRVLGGGVIA